MSARDPELLDGPYKGLLPYGEEDARFFFGREPERELITANLMASRLTLLYGPSGAGKSSVLSAAVVPHLKRLGRARPAGVGRFVVVVYSAWRNDPVVGLAQAIHEAIRGQVPEAVEAMAGDSLRLVALLRSCTEHAKLGLYVILDQFEEYFLYHPAEEEPGTFGWELAEAVADPDVRIGVLVSMREEALARLDRFEGHMSAVFDNRLQVAHLARPAARLAIEEPLAEFGRLHGGEFGAEPALVEAVLDGAEAGKLRLGEGGRGSVALRSPGASGDEPRIEAPYLQLVMSRLWSEEQRSGSPTLRQTTLERLHGVAEIVHTHLEGVMRGFPIEQQEIAARSFHYLVTPTGGKVAYTARDLAESADVPTAAVQAILDRLSDAGVRILKAVDAPLHDPKAPRYEISHDVLGKAVLEWRTRYAGAKHWLETRPWGFVEVLSSGRVHPLSMEVVSIGRSVRWWRHQLDLRVRSVSRVHLLVSQTRAAVDLRSKFGTTVNGTFLTYGDPLELAHQDIIVLAGVAPLRVGLCEYPPFDGSVVDSSPPVPVDQPPPAGWGLLVDGGGRAWWPLTAARYFVSLVAESRLEASTERQPSTFLIVEPDAASGLGLSIEYVGSRSLMMVIKPEETDRPVRVTVERGDTLPRPDGVLRVDGDVVDFKRPEDFDNDDEYRARGYKAYTGPVYVYESAVLQIVPLLPDLDGVRD